jgi:formyl-CoA transferase
LPGPLAGLRVLDLSRVLAGPFCTMLLGDMGADVIKVEQPGTGDDTRRWGPPYLHGEALYYLSVNRNKRGITVDLKHPRGQELVRALARRSALLVENFKVGGLERLGLGFAQLHAVNPRLVYCSITGFGPDGPYRDRRGYDFVAQAMGGIMSLTGEPDGEPQKHGIAIADITTGLLAVGASLAALRHSEASGVGQQVHVSLLETVVGWLTNPAASYLNTGAVPGRFGNAHPNIVPYQVFQARDKPFVVATGNDGQFRGLCRALGQPELARDPRFASNDERVRHRPVLVPLLAELFRQQDAAYWVAALLAEGVPTGPINRLDEVFADPQVLARGLLAEVEHPTLGTLRLAGPAAGFSATPGAVERHPPLLGEHTDQVLSEILGLDQVEIAELRRLGAI